MAGNTEVFLAWASVVNPSITGYEYSKDDGTSWAAIATSDATTTSYTATGLTNETAYTFRVRAVNADGSSPASDSATATPSASLTPALIFSTTGITVTEASGNDHTKTYTVRLNVLPAGSVTVTVASGDTIVATVSPASLTFTTGNWSTAQTVTVTGIDDDKDDPTDRSANITHSGSGSGYDGVTGSVKVTLTDDDDATPVKPTVTLVLTPSSISENGGVSTVTVTLSKPLGQETTLYIDTTPADAEDNDFALNDYRLLFKAGETTSDPTKDPVTITAADNSVRAPNKTVTVSVGRHPGGMPSPVENIAVATLTITDEDNNIVLTPPALTAVEGAANQTYSVKLTDAPTDTVTVAVASDDTAVASVSPASLSFTAANWGTAQTITVDVADDDDIDNDGRTATITHTASGAEYDGLTVTLLVTLTDNDPEPTATLVLTPDSIGEAGGISTVTASLSGKSSEATTITVTATPDSGTAPGDFTLSSNTTLTIAAGATASSGVVTITGVDNSVDAPHKTVTVSGTASNDQGVTGPANQTLTITDDDEPVGINLTASPVSVDETGNATDITITATLTGGVTRATTTPVTISLGDTGTAERGAGKDYTAVTADITIPASASSGTATLKVTPIDDAVVEGDETIIVNGAVTGLTVSPVTIKLNDDTATLTLTPATQDVTEGAAAASFTVTLSHQVNAAVAVAWAATAGTAASDYSPASGTVTFTANSAAGATQTFTIAITNDQMSETAEDFTVALGAVTSTLSSHVTADTTAVTVTIAESDPITVNLTGGASVAEGAMNTYTVTLSPAGVIPTADLTVNYTTADGTAKAGSDYTTKTGTLTFTEGSSAAQNIDVPTINDTIYEVSENFTFTISNLAGGGGPTPILGTATKTTTITSDDLTATSVTLTASQASVAESNETEQNITITATLDGTRTTATTVTISLAGTAERGTGKDYTATTANVTIPANIFSDTATLSITPIDDAVVEGDETIIVTGSVTGLTGFPATITLNDDTATLTLSPTMPVTQATQDANEGESASFTVTLSHQVNADVTVAWAATAGTAMSDDYGTGSGTVTFTANSLAGATKTFTIAIINDKLSETAEDFTVALGAVTSTLSSHVTADTTS